MFLTTSGDSKDVAHEIVVVRRRGFEGQPAFARDVEKEEFGRRAIMRPGVDLEDDVGGAFVEVLEDDM